MSGNRFEDLARDELLRRDDRRAAEARAAAAVSDAARLEQMNLQRKQTNFGNTPEQVWGQEAQEICTEFLEFVGKVSLRPHVLMGAYPLKTPPHVNTAGWVTSGYGVAYVDPNRNVGVDFFDIGRRGNHGQTTALSRSTEPRMKTNHDVFLCVDGLLRHHTQPLDLSHLDGRVKPPVTGTFTMTHTVRALQGSYTVNRDGNETYNYTSHQYLSAFTELAPTEGLQVALSKHAADILQDVERQR